MVKKVPVFKRGCIVTLRLGCRHSRQKNTLVTLPQQEHTHTHLEPRTARRQRKGDNHPTDEKEVEVEAKSFHILEPY
jgi:hypothetical protein